MFHPVLPAFLNQTSLPHSGSYGTLVIVNDLDIMRVSIAPTKANAKAIVYANAVLPLAVSAQRFKAITRGDCKIAQISGIAQQDELPQGRAGVGTRP